MERAISLDGLAAGRQAPAMVWPFVAISLGVAVLAAALAGWMPIGLSIATVFLFAGPHNWIEFRYFLSRMPVKWGRSRHFFQLAIVGAVGLTALYAALSFLARAQSWEARQWALSAAIWNSLLIFWLAALVFLRGRQSAAQRDWSWAIPAGLALVAVNWLAPLLFSLSLVYLHPLMALWFLDRQLRSRPAWLRAYRACLLLLPLLVGVLWWRLAGAPHLAGDDALTLRITQHAGAGILAGVSTHLLVATHVFLETLHYGIWLVAIPLAGLRTAPWRLQTVPLFRHPQGWPRAVCAALIAGACGVILLWASFLADYTATRDVYFTVAMFHVLAEAPFLLRTL
jgi:hypothetical protein